MTETGTPAFWVGVRGDLTAAQQQTLATAGMASEAQLRESNSSRGGAWTTLRTFVRVGANDDAAAKGKVADALGIEAADLVAYDAGTFR